MALYIFYGDKNKYYFSYIFTVLCIFNFSSCFPLKSKDYLKHVTSCIAYRLLRYAFWQSKMISQWHSCNVSIC